MNKKMEFELPLALPVVKDTAISLVIVCFIELGFQSTVKGEIFEVLNLSATTPNLFYSHHLIICITLPPSST